MVNKVLQRQIESVGALLLQAMLAKGDCAETRRIQDEHKALLARRTPEHLAALAKRLPVGRRV